MWVEVARSKKDWDEVLEMFGKEFVDSAIARRYLPDIEKRKLLMPLFVRYLYEARYSDNRAVMLSVKMHEKITNGHGIQENRSRIIGAWLSIYDFIPRKADITKMIDVDEDGTTRLLRMEKWREQNIHQIIHKAAKDFDMKAIYGARIAVHKAYRDEGILKKHTRQAQQIFYEEIKKRNGNEDKIFSYWISLEKKAISDYRVELAHLHYNFKPGLRCCEDFSSKDESGISCHFVLVEQKMIEKLRKYFPIFNKL
uniref:uncharacterized protein LOC120339364 n=1 Tax=Styela clava TaxID=7725 RepID=UPI00193A3172|nr:uncharacterized protein LOC120339364 [Styela clava]